MVLVNGVDSRERFLAYALSCAVLTDLRPVYGLTAINIRFVEVSVVGGNNLVNTMIHELIHIIGFSSAH